MCQILYREKYGAGDDSEEENPNGIVVTASHWETDEVDAPSHFLIEAIVMIDRHDVVKELEVVREHWNTATRETIIRKAIARFEQLKELNPEIMEGRHFS